MSTALSEISVAVFDNVVEICNRIMFDFPQDCHTCTCSLFLTTVKFCILVQVLECVCSGYVAPLGWAGSGRGQDGGEEKRDGLGRERGKWKEGRVR